MKKILLLSTILFTLIGCSSKSKVATLNQGVSELRSRYHYTLYVPRRPLVHDPISAITTPKYYAQWDIYINNLGQQRGSSVAYVVEKNSVKYFNESAIFNFSKNSIRIKGVQICNVDNECYDAGLDGRFKIVEKAPKKRAESTVVEPHVPAYLPPKGTTAYFEYTYAVQEKNGVSQNFKFVEAEGLVCIVAKNRPYLLNEVTVKNYPCAKFNELSPHIQADVTQALGL